MNGIDGRLASLLEELQRDFPRVPRPFREIGQHCGLDEQEALTCTRDALSHGLIREIAALLDGRRLGFRSSLVALRAGDRAEELAAGINRHPGVSHNYLREHDWNLWFTLAVPPSRELAEEVARLAGAVETLILPAVRTFKLRVRLPFSGRAATAPETEEPPAVPGEAASPAALSCFERRLLACLENPLPLAARPWREIGTAIEATEEQVLEALDELKAKRVLRRIAAVLHHRRVGFQANAMACFQLPDSRLLEAGARAARLQQVSHCYQRQTRAQWPYSLYAMMHARTREECDELVRGLAADLGSQQHQILYSLRELKKQRIKYFGGLE